MIPAAAHQLCVRFHGYGKARFFTVRVLLRKNIKEIVRVFETVTGTRQILFSTQFNCRCSLNNDIIMFIRQCFHRQQRKAQKLASPAVTFRSTVEQESEF